jgi:hypothetical protein
VKPLSLIDPFVVLAEYGALTLALQSTKIPDGYQMVIQKVEFPKTIQGY